MLFLHYNVGVLRNRARMGWIGMYPADTTEARVSIRWLHTQPTHPTQNSVWPLQGCSLPYRAYKQYSYPPESQLSCQQLPVDNYRPTSTILGMSQSLNEGRFTMQKSDEQHCIIFQRAKTFNLCRKIRSHLIAKQQFLSWDKRIMTLWERNS